MSAPLICRDCQCPAGPGDGHYYTLRDDLWRSIADKRDILCLDCCEARLGRTLTADMFTALPTEIISRFSGANDAPGAPASRQRDLDSWRAYIRANPVI